MTKTDKSFNVTIGAFTLLRRIVKEGECPWVELRDGNGLSDGAVYSHLRRLEMLGLIRRYKSFKGMYPLTTYKPTESGKRFEAETMGLLTNANLEKPAQ